MMKVMLAKPTTKQLKDCLDTTSLLAFHQHEKVHFYQNCLAERTNRGWRMSLFDYFIKKKEPSSAQSAKDRLQIVIAHQRGSGEHVSSMIQFVKTSSMLLTNTLMLMITLLMSIKQVKFLN